MKSLCVIPTKSISQELPNKLFLELNGKPLLHYVLESTKDNFDTIITASNSQDILDYAKDRTDTYLAKLGNTAVDMVLETAKNNKVSEYDTIYWALPPYILLKNSTVKKLVSTFNKLIELKTGYTSIIAIKKMDFPADLFVVIKDNKLVPYKHHRNYHKKRTARQLHEFQYRPTGLYGAKVDKFLETGHFFTDYIYPFEISKVEGQDIDDKEDFKIAEAIIEKQN